jgi:hypothetical protein
MLFCQLQLPYKSWDRKTTSAKKHPAACPSAPINCSINDPFLLTNCRSSYKSGDQKWSPAWILEIKRCQDLPPGACQQTSKLQQSPTCLCDLQFRSTQAPLLFSSHNQPPAKPGPSLGPKFDNLFRCQTASQVSNSFPTQHAFIIPGYHFLPQATTKLHSSIYFNPPQPITLPSNQNGPCLLLPLQSFSSAVFTRAIWHQETGKNDLTCWNGLAKR